jgi:beta-galactosidase/beta-glucuronidase
MKELAMRTILALCLAAAATAHAEEYTRGVGVYPGDPKEYSGPTPRIDASTYRNLALRRPAYHSSAYDYNLTAQLVTDGIKATSPPRWLATTTSDRGLLAKNEREWIFDSNWVTGVDLKGPSAWLEVEIGGGDGAPEVDRVEVDGSLQGPRPDNQIWTCTILASDDGRAWKPLGRVSGMARPTGEIRPSISLATPARSRHYRVELDTGRAGRWRVGELTLSRNGAPLRLAGPWHFTSAWMAAAAGEQWVYVDLGASCTFDRVALFWIRRPAEAVVQVSTDATAWKSVQTIGDAQALTDDLKLARPVQGRYVRVLATRDRGDGPVILSELEVHGRGGPVPQPRPAPLARSDGRTDLAGGTWRVERDSLVHAGGEELSKAGFPDGEWVPATVPGTVLTSYYNAGALPDPNFGDNQLMISDSFFHADFWYRREFAMPPLGEGRRLFVHFDGINWKADVFLNGRKLGRIEGSFLRDRFDVTGLVRAGQANALAVRVERMATPGSIKEKTYENPDKNGGALGADNPTFHATIGWDWIPTMRGRDTGIWNSAYLTTSGSVTIEDPFVDTTLPLPDTTPADVAVVVTLRNHEAREVSGTLRGRLGDVAFETPVTIGAGATKAVRLDPTTHPALRIQKPRLWWPAGYGEPALYRTELRFETGNKAVSDVKVFETGLRQFTYSEEGGALKIWVNGRHLVPRGGNWGFSESMLRYRAREYDAAVRYHRDMNFTMIRNWVGQVGEDAFYEACDRHGIVVWQDFWLANPWDGPDPDDDGMFLRNVRDTILRIRSHPSVGLYCGRNEGYPPKPLDDGIRQALAETHPGIHYISSSADDAVSGHGPYRAMPPKHYFEQRATPKLHSELGMPNIVTLESLKQMMPESAMWPQGNVWGLHDFSLDGAQGGRSFLDRIQKAYGGATSAKEWVTLAQFVNYEGYRAMFEAQSRNRMGLLIWMSHPAWPSFVWQTYDYYLEPTAAYFGAKKASEPLHVQWNPVSDSVEVVNYSAGEQKGLTAQAEILNLDGSVKWEKTATLDSAEDSVASPIKMEYPAGLSPVHFIRLKLVRDRRVHSENFYWRGLEEGNFTALRELPKVTLTASTRAVRTAEGWNLTTELANNSGTPAVMVRLKAVREKGGDRILPALYSDNYVSLMPAERRTVTTELRLADTRGESPRIVVEGFNVGSVGSR